MLLDCPACARSYHVDRGELDGGRTVICPRCETQWFVDLDAHDVTAPTEGVGAPNQRGTTPFDLPARIPAPSLFGWVRPVAGVAASLALVMAFIGCREHVVRVAPRIDALFVAAGMPVNVRGLAFDGVTPVRGDQVASEVTITGEIRNVAARCVVMPRLAYEVRNAAGETLVSWTEKAPAKALGTGKTLAFVSQPHLVPEQARSVLVRFVADDAPIRLAGDPAR